MTKKILMALVAVAAVALASSQIHPAASSTLTPVVYSYGQVTQSAVSMEFSANVSSGTTITSAGWDGGYCIDAGGAALTGSVVNGNLRIRGDGGDGAEAIFGTEGMCPDADAFISTPGGPTSPAYFTLFD